jgi:NAD(P)-dependent dehydrogenase (short-subunit alcohol dehydrogenase family)
MYQGEVRVALVTGANKGIGFEVARQLGQLGFRVLLGSRDSGRGSKAAETLRAAGIDVRFEQLDVSEPHSVTAAAARIRLDPGRLDVLVNNAGVLSSGEFYGVDESGEPILCPPSQVELGAVQATYLTNVFGPIAVINAVLPLLRESPAGRIVNVSSRLASFSVAQAAGSADRYLNLLAYNSSKAALNYTTLQYAIELRGTRIKVNAADPGHCATDINGRLGTRSPAEAARIVVQLATLPDDGPTGAFFAEEGARPW